MTDLTQRELDANYLESCYLEDLEDTKLAIERKDSIPEPITLEELAAL